MSDTGHLKCPRCGKELKASAPEGLCPACLGALNFATDTAFTGAETKEPMPTLTPAELAPQFPQLEILECLGRGGMGVVYKARQKSLHRLVALKLLAPERVQDAKFAARFEKEAQALAVLNHPNIVTVHDFGQAGGFYYLLMEFVDGVNLRQLLRSRKLQPSEALAIVPPICEALQYAHEHGIVHRDIKPENLLLAKDGRVKIADFGIAKMLGSETSAASISLASSGGEGQGEEASAISATQQTTMGTPQYMAPEQLEHPQAADHRADIYSLGVVLYELLTGELPADKLQPPSRVRGVQIDVRLDEIVLRALEKTPELRYQTAGEFKTQVETVVSHPQGANSQQGASTVRLPRSGRCYVTSREKLSTFEGQIFLYRNKSEMILDEKQIIFNEAKKSTVIPLTAIQNLGLGQFPAAVNPVGLNYIHVTYLELGVAKSLVFAPCDSLLGSPDNFNQHVNEWFETIRAAATTASNRPPGNVPEPAVTSTPQAGLAKLGMLLLPVVLGVVAVATMMQIGEGNAVRLNAWVLPLVIGIVALGLLLPLVLRRFMGGGGIPTGGNAKVGFPVGTVVFYTGVILGILLIGMLPFRFSRDSAYLLVVGIMVVISSFTGVMMGRAWQWALSTQDWKSVEIYKDRFKALSIVAWILALPVVGFAVFFFLAMLDERGKWNPATSEAVIVPLTWLGAVLLPWAGMRLWGAASQAGIDSQPKKADGKGVFLWVTGAMLVVFLLAGFAWLSANARRVAEAQSAAQAAAERAVRRSNEEGMVRTNHAEASQTTSNLVSTPDWSVASTHTVVVPTKFGFPVVAIIFILGLGVGVVTLLVWVSRKHGVKGCLIGGLVVGAVLLAVGLLVVLAYWGFSVREIRKGFQPIATMELSGINQNSPPATPNGLAMQVQNGLNLKVPPGQLVTFEVFIRYGDDHREPVPALTAVVATDEGYGINTWLSWMGKREDDGQGTNQLWSWSVNGNVLGTVPMPNRTDYGTNMAWQVKPREVLNWWQLAMPKSMTMNAGSIQEIALFRTFGSATADPAQPKEIIARIKRHALPEEMKMQVGQYQMLLGLEAYEKVDAWNQKAGIGVKRVLENPVPTPLVSKEMVEQARKDSERAKALLGTASLIQAKAAGLSWRWRVNKQQSARLLFGLTDSDLNGVLGTIVPVSLRENEVVNGDWSVEKDILLTTTKTGDSSQVKLEEKSISPLARFQQTASLGATLESWQQIISQTQPITLSSSYYQTLWEAEVVRYSADGKTRSPRRLRVVARLADPDEAENIEVLQDSDPVKEVRAIENKGKVSAGQGMDTASKSIALRSVTNHSGAISMMSKTALLPGEILQPVLRFEDGRLEPGGVTYFVFKNKERSDRDTLSLSWQPFPGLAPELELAAVEQIRERWTSNDIMLLPGQASRVFTVTNAEGVLIHGEVNFKRSHSMGGETKAAASLVFEKTSGFGQSLMLHFYNGSIPEGYKLVANGVIPESLSGEAHTHVNKGIHGQMGTFSWSLRPRRSLTRDELLQRGGFMGAGGFAEEAARQINNRGAKGPILVRPGKPTELFSVTNSAGEVFKGYLELVGNKP